MLKYTWLYIQEFQAICHNLSKEQVEAAFNKFDLSGNNKEHYFMLYLIFLF